MDIEKEIKDMKRKILFNNLLILFFIGTLLNVTIISLNNGKMPVLFYENEQLPQINNSIHLPFQEWDDVKYPFLGDVFIIKKSFFDLRFSIGDALIIISMITMIFLFSKNQFANLKQWRLKHGVVIND